MKNTEQFPRVRIFEKDFPAKIPRDIKESFLEVVNEDEETIALFFLWHSFHKADFKDGFDFAEYYDSLGVELWEDADIEEKMKVFGYSSPKEWWESLENVATLPTVYGESSDFFLIDRVLPCYGRLKYPYGLNENGFEYWKDQFSYEWLTIRDLIQDHNTPGAIPELEKYWDEILDIFIFFLNLIFNLEERAGYLSYFWENYDFDIFIQIAERLFTKENIDQYITLELKEPSSDYYEYAPFVEYLQTYRDNHFPPDEST